MRHLRAAIHQHYINESFDIELIYKHNGLILQVNNIRKDAFISQDGVTIMSGINSTFSNGGVIIGDKEKLTEIKLDKDFDKLWLEKNLIDMAYKSYYSKFPEPTKA